MSETVATKRPNHWWHDPDGDGHNCTFCPDESIWKCDQAAHLQPSVREAEFVRRVVEKVDLYQHDMTPERVVGFAYRQCDIFIHSEDGMALTDENALKMAAIMVAFSRPAPETEAKAHYIVYRRLTLEGFSHNRANRVATGIVADIKTAVGMAFTENNALRVAANLATTTSEKKSNDETRTDAIHIIETAKQDGFITPHDCQMVLDVLYEGGKRD